MQTDGHRRSKSGAINASYAKAIISRIAKSLHPIGAWSQLDHKIPRSWRYETRTRSLQADNAGGLNIRIRQDRRQNRLIRRGIEVQNRENLASAMVAAQGHVRDIHSVHSEHGANLTYDSRDVIIFQ